MLINTQHLMAMDALTRPFSRHLPLWINIRSEQPATIHKICAPGQTCSPLVVRDNFTYSGCLVNCSDGRRQWRREHRRASCTAWPSCTSTSAWGAVSCAPWPLKLMGAPRHAELQVPKLCLQQDISSRINASVIAQHRVCFKCPAQRSLLDLPWQFS